MKFSIRLLKVFSSVLPVMAVMALSAAPYIAPQAVQAANLSKKPLEISVSNFECVSDRLYRGAQPSERALEQLADGGVKTIIDLRLDGSGTEKEEVETRKLGMKYVHIPMGFKHTPVEKVAQAMRVLMNPLNQPVYVHCRQGADRTGTVCGVYRRVADGWSYDQAYHEMRQHHFKPFLVGMKKIVKDCDSKEFSDQFNIPVAAVADRPAQL